MGSHLVKINYYKTYKTYSHVVGLIYIHVPFYPTYTESLPILPMSHLVSKHEDVSSL
jgi:hypothetical protein